MINIIKKILFFKLRFVTKLILRKYQPTIIAVTGSVGKTTTVHAIHKVLSSTYSVRKGLKNYNNEVGVPLTVLGTQNPGKSFFGWLKLFFYAKKLILFKDKNYPHILVVEMGADHPGDISYLTKFVRPDISVVTAVSAAHTEFFETIDSVAKEKSKIVEPLRKMGLAVLNHDDKNVYAMRNVTQARVKTFGLQKGSDYYVSHVKHEDGLRFDLHSGKKVVRTNLKNIIAEHFLLSVLAAVAIGEEYDLTLADIIKSLKDFEAPKGRMRKVNGIKGTTIIDDTYNSSPLALKKALETLFLIPQNVGTKKYAVLGDMLELGSITERAHQEAGMEVANRKIDYLITVGERARDFSRGAKGSGMSSDKIFSFSKSEEAGKFLQNRIKKGDVILVKGSQGVRMEKIVKEIMSEPLKAKELLVRQDSSWLPQS